MSESTKKKGFFSGIVKFAKEVKSEMKKVIWPDKKTVAKNTGTVLMFSLLVGVCIWVFDFVMTSAVQMILSIFGA